MRQRKLIPEEVQELRSLIKHGKHSPETKRAQAVLLLDREAGTEDIGLLTDLSRSQIFNLRRRYLEEGVNALVDKREGKPKELLTRKQREEIIETIKTKSPKACDPRLIYDHWTTGLLGKYIKEAYGVQYRSRTSHYLIFKKAEFFYHKPGRVYHERNEEEVKEWKRLTKPALATFFKEKDIVILAGDEMVLTTQTTTQKIWLPKGEYPKIEVSTGGRQRRHLYGFLNMKTGQEHVWKTELQNMYVTVGVLKNVRRCYPVKKIVLLWDSAGWHKGSVVQEFVKTDGNIKIIHFPRYAPEENPQEHVWKSGRSRCSHNKFIENIDAATDEFVEYLNAGTFNYSLLGFSPIS